LLRRTSGVWTVSSMRHRDVVEAGRRTVGLLDCSRNVNRGQAYRIQNCRPTRIDYVAWLAGNSEIGTPDPFVTHLVSRTRIRVYNASANRVPIDFHQHRLQATRNSILPELSSWF